MESARFASSTRTNTAVPCPAGGSACRGGPHGMGVEPTCEQDASQRTVLKKLKRLSHAAAPVYSPPPIGQPNPARHVSAPVRGRDLSAASRVACHRTQL